MTAQAATIVTDTRVIVADTATKDQLQQAANENPGKSVYKASSMKPNFIPDENTKLAGEVADLRNQVRRLQSAVDQLLAAKDTKAVRTVSMATEAPPVEVEAETVTNEVEEAPEVVAAPEPEAPKAPKAPKVTKPAPKAEAPAKPRRKLSELSYDELKDRVTKRGGKVERILRNKIGGPARKKALIAWIVANKNANK